LDPDQCGPSTRRRTEQPGIDIAENHHLDVFPRPGAAQSVPSLESLENTFALDLAAVAGTVSYLHMHVLVELQEQPRRVATLTG
jgi:hypothetical protein